MTAKELENLFSLNPAFRKLFTTFLAYYNSANGSSLTPKEALSIPLLVSVFISTAKDFKANYVDVCSVVNSKPRKSTKKRSLDMLNVEDCRVQILTFIQANPGLSRREISVGSEKLLQSVTGRCRELIEMGLIYVSGERLDSETGRVVETLSACVSASKKSA